MNSEKLKPISAFKRILICVSVLGLVCITAIAFVNPVLAQQARVYEKKEMIKTYPFDDPDPIPILIKKKALYPYFRYDGYSSEGKTQAWNVVYLENPYIKVSVLPDAGGKVYGAIEKSTGKDFIYHNEVLKFRDVGLRGPWTSGGIEFNFGYIGHTPATATPVDYTLKENEDGSVSCFIGGLDLSSRTRWRVEIRLPKDAATFQTKSFWYNATPMNQSYYYWSNAAIHAGDGLELYFPGTNYIGHGGDAHSWPVDKEGRKISLYKNNDFGSHKSYHVLGTYENYTGAYWNNSDFGYGRWAHYNEMPGKKVWIWALSRNGGIWEDLLTDDNGQYVEVQSGRLFSQANFNSGYSSPFNQYLFAPGTSDRWEDYWFPVKGIGGIADAAPYGSINVTQHSDKLNIAINAIKPIEDTLKVFSKNKVVHTEAVELDPMEVFKTEVRTPSNQKGYTVRLGSELEVSNEPKDKQDVHRPLHSEQKYDPSTAEGQFEIGEEQFSSRQYDEALQSYLKSLKMLPNQRRTLARIAEIYTRKGEYEQALNYAKRVLENDTYDAEGNLIYGVINHKMGNLVQAKDAFGWAARSMKYRSLGLEKIAEIDIYQRRWDDVIYYAKKALNYNAFNMNALQALAIAYRKEAKNKEAGDVIAKILDIDPLSHAAYFEQYQLTPSSENKHSFTSLIRNELAYETYLELAIDYSNIGLNKEAQTILKLAPSHPMVNYWLAYLDKGNAEQSKQYLNAALNSSSKLAFPFRLESIPVLNWALKQDENWQTRYYLGLVLWAKGQNDKALALMNECGSDPDFAPFYISRSYLREDKSPEFAKEDIQRALDLGQDEWRTYYRMSDWLVAGKKYDEAADVTGKAFNKFPKNYYIGGQYASILFEQENYSKSLDILNNLLLLPSEGAWRGHSVFAQDHLMLALKNIRANNYSQALDHLKASRTWPEHLGTGKPFNPDERAQDFLEAYIYEAQHKSQLADPLYQKISSYSNDVLSGERTRIQFNFGNVAGMLAYAQQGKQQKAKKLLDGFINDLGMQNPAIDWLESKINDKEPGQNNWKQLIKRKDLNIPDWFAALVQLN